MKCSRIDLTRHPNRRQSLSHIIHTISSVLKLFSSFVGYGLIQGKFSLLMQGSTDIDIHVQSINFCAFLLRGELSPVSKVVDLLLVPAQLHGLSHAFWKLVNLVLDDG